MRNSFVFLCAEMSEQKINLIRQINKIPFFIIVDFYIESFNKQIRMEFEELIEFSG